MVNASKSLKPNCGYFLEITFGCSHLCILRFQYTFSLRSKKMRDLPSNVDLSRTRLLCQLVSLGPFCLLFHRRGSHHHIDHNTMLLASLLFWSVQPIVHHHTDSNLAIWLLNRPNLDCTGSLPAKKKKKLSNCTQQCTHSLLIRQQSG